MNDGGGNDASCGRIKVTTDTTKLSMAMASFGDGRNLIREGNMTYLLNGVRFLNDLKLNLRLTSFFTRKSLKNNIPSAQNSLGIFGGT